MKYVINKKTQSRMLKMSWFLKWNKLIWRKLMLKMSWFFKMQYACIKKTINTIL